MTKPLTIAAAFIGTLALFYLFGAFVAWDWDAGNWDSNWLLSVALLGLSFAIPASSRIGNRYDKS